MPDGLRCRRRSWIVRRRLVRGHRCRARSDHWQRWRFGFAHRNAALGAVPVVAVLAVLGLGMCSAGVTTPWQHRVEHLAGPGAILAASLPASAGNLGDAIGAFAGGRAIDTGGVPAAILAAAILSAVAIIIAIASRSLRPAPSLRTTQARTAEPAPALVH